MFFDISYIGAFLGGMLSFLSPCVLPLLPPYLCFLAGKSYAELNESANKNEKVSWQTVFASLAFVMGFTIVFTILGASASFLGQWVGQYFHIFSILAGGIIILLGMHFIGLFKISWLMQDTRFQLSYTKANIFTALIVGMAFAFGWTPCVGPILAAVLAVAATEEDLIKGISLLLSYSLGIGLPFIIAAFFISFALQTLQKIRPYLPMIEKISGVLLILTGILFMTGSMSDIAFFMLEYIPALG